ncbi:MAG: hypothetical protein MJ245_00460 [Clostridia bacterium]|nr:hypothetical protein [Clostridia bacterium]
MIDTTEAGGGSYPEPPEPKEKCYKFEFNASISGYGYVTAKNKEEAERFIFARAEDDIADTYDMQIEEITSIEEN